MWDSQEVSRPLRIVWYSTPMNKLLALLTLLLAPSCATVSMMPQSASEVDFDGVEGKTGWSEYKQVATFSNTSIEEIYLAAKVGLGSAGFELLVADKAQGYVIGEHGMTLHDWNIIAGVYFVPGNTDMKVAVIVEGSKDIGFSGDVTGDAWTSKILSGMRNSLR
jgi:hypothetical protein